jgi:hypothetical protein
MQIEGTNFTTDCVVDFGTVPGIKPTYISPTQLSVTIPSGVGVVPVTVTNMFGTSATSDLVLCTAPPAPNPGPFCTFTYTPVVV